MLRLTDARSSEPTPIAPAPGRALRVAVAGAGLRSLLVADLVRRLGEVLHDWRVLVDAPPSEAAAAMNVHPGTAAEGRPDLVIGGQRESTISLLVADFTAPASLPDPLALRLALLERHYADAVEVTSADLDEAGVTIERWRAAVATWAISPGAPMSQQHVREIAEAFDDNLATTRALKTLRELLDDETIAAGAKFETFAYADRLLGLDLAREVGR